MRGIPSSQRQGMGVADALRIGGINSVARLAVVAAAFLAGCCHDRQACDRSAVSQKVACRTGYGLGSSDCPGELILPNGARLEDGLTEDEAVFIALWNNALFQELLTDLGIAHGDLIQAGLLPNPEVVYFFPVSDKPYKYAIDMPLEALWLRPIRIAAAERESARVCQRLAQAGLDLIRDTRQAYANVLLAQERLQIAEEAHRIRSAIAAQAAERLDAGDVSVQESKTAEIDSLVAQQDLVRLRHDVSLAEERLRNLLALGGDRTPLMLDPTMRAPLVDLDAVTLAEEAVSSRPDVLAARQNAAGAEERLRLSKHAWFRFLGIADATSGTGTGHELGPAIRATLPIFNCNQGAIARAEAELEKAQRQHQTVVEQIRLDVHQAHIRYSQARSELTLLQSEVRPEAENAIRRAEAAYREGDTNYVVVLQTTRQLLDSRNREAQLRTDVRLAWADLERSVGRRLDGEPAQAGNTAPGVLPLQVPEPAPPADESGAVEGTSFKGSAVEEAPFQQPERLVFPKQKSSTN